MSLTLKVEIELGSDAMRTADDVAASLRKLAARYDPFNGAVLTADSVGGRMRDVYNRPVGTWQAVESDVQAETIVNAILMRTKNGMYPNRQVTLTHEQYRLALMEAAQGGN